MSLSRKALIAISVFNLFRGVSIGLYQALFPMYIVTLGYSMSNLGVIISGSSLLAGLLSPMMGSFIENRGAKTAVVMTGLLFSTSFFLLIIGDYPFLLFLSYATFFLSFALSQPARATYLAYSASVTSLGTYIGLSSTAFSIGRMIGPGGGGLLAGRAGFEEAFLAGLSIILWATLVFYISAPSVGRPGRSAPTRKSLISTSYRELVSLGREAPLLYATVAVDRFAWTLWFPMLSAHLYSSGLSEELSGMTLTLMSVAQTLSLPFWGRLVDKLDPKSVIAGSEILGVASIALIIDPYPLARAMAGGFLIGLSIGAWVPSYNKIVALVFKKRLGEAYASVNSLRMLSGSPSPLIGGALYENLGSLPVFALSSAILMIASILSLKIQTSHTIHTTRTQKHPLETSS